MPDTVSHVRSLNRRGAIIRSKFHESGGWVLLGVLNKYLPNE